MMKFRTTGRPSFRPSKFKKRNKPPNELYGEDWPTISEYVRRRDNYTCLAHKINLPPCGRRYAPPFSHLLHVHHIVPLPRGSNHPTNLITLCVECHGRTHGKYLGRITRKQDRAAKNFRCY